MKPAEFHPLARREVEDAAAHYEGERPGLGREFREEFEAALTRVRENPSAYSPEQGEFRACPLRRFSYTIFYADLADHVWVAAVAHQSRRPGYWARRKPD
jgi:plasmid stabilization system protein ParE